MSLHLFSALLAAVIWDAITIGAGIVFRHHGISRLGFACVLHLKFIRLVRADYPSKQGEKQKVHLDRVSCMNRAD